MNKDLPCINIILYLWLNRTLNIVIMLQYIHDQLREDVLVMGSPDNDRRIIACLLHANSGKCGFSYGNQIDTT